MYQIHFTTSTTSKTTSLSSFYEKPKRSATPAEYRERNGIGITSYLITITITFVDCLML